MSTVSFADLGVPSDLVAVLDREGIASPFEVQSASIPDALAGRDVLGRAPTGSGKTLAFGIPLVAQLQKAKPRRPRALVLSPTRELAEQIRRALEPLAQQRGRSVLSIYGGVGFGAQTTGLRKGADLIVACPGRLIDLIEQGQVSLGQVDYVVVDEADRMADMGFLPAVRHILDLTSSDRQTVFFSATLDKEVQVLIDNYQTDPVTHQVGEVEPDLTLVTHKFYRTKAEEKLALAADTIDQAGPTVVFCRTRHGVDRVARQLKSAGIKSGWIHGGRSQSQRDAALHAFISGKVQALVATDVAARGIHVDGVACVIHFDPPQEYKDYVHRSGRTARAGADGLVVSFINTDQVKSAKRMMRDVGLPPTEIEAAPDTSDRAAHIKIELRARRARNGAQKGDRPGGDAKRAREGRKNPKRDQPARKERPVRAGQDWRTRDDAPDDRPERAGERAGKRPSSRKRPERREDGGWSVTTSSGEERPRTAKAGSSKNGSAKNGSAKNGSAKNGTRKPGMPKKLRIDGTAAPKRSHQGPKTKRSGKPRPKNKKAGR